MSYHKIKKSLQDRFSSKVELNDQYHIYIESSANNWNIAAIALVEESLKVPSQRKQLTAFPNIQIKENSIGVKKSTNDWNNMALNLARHNS